MKCLKIIESNVWTYDGSTVSWYGMPYTTRMTVVRLEGNQLWVHSPEILSEGLSNEMQELGEVKFLISPNKIHHLYIHDWMTKYPEAKSYSAPGLKEERKDVCFYKELNQCPEGEWADEIDQLIFMGSRAMDEVVFFHKKTRTLILTDLIENFGKHHFSGFQKLIAYCTGIVSPNGKTPLDWRLSFIFRKKKTRESLAKMIKWNPSRIIISHGECIDSNAVPFLKKSFGWVGLKGSEI